MKVWSISRGCVSKFLGHTRAVTGVLLHPDNSNLVLTSSIDATVRVWSLDIMECIYV